MLNFNILLNNFSSDEEGDDVIVGLNKNKADNWKKI